MDRKMEDDMETGVKGLCREKRIQRRPTAWGPKVSRGPVSDSTILFSLSSYHGTSSTRSTCEDCTFYRALWGGSCYNVKLALDFLDGSLYMRQLNQQNIPTCRKHRVSFVW